jgi:hypothetical protein
LAIAHQADCEQQLGEHLQAMMSGQRLPVLNDLQLKFNPSKQTVPDIKVKQSPVTGYNVLLGASSQEVH